MTRNRLGAGLAALLVLDFLFGLAVLIELGLGAELHVIALDAAACALLGVVVVRRMLRKLEN